MNKREKGFSLIELLIVVAIILIIAAIAIPNLLRSRMAANEASAVGSIRTIVTAEVTFASTYGDEFSPDLATIGGTGTVASCTNALLIDNLLAQGTKSGYTFVFTAGSQMPSGTPPSGCAGLGYNTFSIVASPITVGTTGQRAFCSDQSGVIRFDPSGAFTGADGNGCNGGGQPLQ
jgi:type IV pilus assembly protein PilA